MVKGRMVGWFAPQIKFLSESYNKISGFVDPIKAGGRGSMNGGIRTITGGGIDFWSLENENAGRGRFYDDIFVDEAAFAKDNMLDIWERNLEPTLLDYGGNCYVMSNTKGIDDANFFYRICTLPDLGFTEYHAPTYSNPNMPIRHRDESAEQYAIRRAAVFAKLKSEKPPLVFSQEYDAEFVDWSGVAFFSKESMLFQGQPLPLPKKVDAVFAIVDTASKTGTEHDGTSVMYFALKKNDPICPLYILDWDVQQILGAHLETWLPNVFKILEHFAQVCEARSGSLGAMIEDQNSGTVLIQRATINNWPATAIESGLTAMGKDERAIACSGHVYLGKTKWTEHAYNKTTTYKGITRNHAWTQVTGFRVGDKEAAKREDDLLDCFCYGNIVAHGTAEGF